MRFSHGLYGLVGCVLAATGVAWGSDGPRGQVVEELEGDPLIRVLPRDAIPAIERPRMVPAAKVSRWLRDEEPVLGVVVGDQARAYPLWYLDRHEIVNDTAGGRAIAATW